MKKYWNDTIKLMASISICALFLLTTVSSATFEYTKRQSKEDDNQVLSETAVPLSNHKIIAESRSAEINPLDDAQVAEGYPSTNYGDETYLYVQSATSEASDYEDERAWIKFDLSGSVPDESTIESAKLKLLCWKATGPDMGASVHGSTEDSWDEMLITWDNQPLFGTELDSTILLTGQTIWKEWNVTTFVQNEWNGDKIVSFVIKPTIEDSPSVQTFAFDSKEYSSGDPVLRITYSGSGDDAWGEVSSSPQIYAYAVGVVGAGEYVYLANSGFSGPELLMSYNINTGEWNEFLNPGGSAYYFKNNIAMVWDGDHYIYTLFGGSYSDCRYPERHRYYFRRFNMISNLWEDLQNTSWYQGAGDAMTWVEIGGNEYIYALLGTSSCSGSPGGYPGPPYPEGVQFWRYDVANDVWDQNLNRIPYGADDGASLVWTGGDYIYGFSGAYNEGLPPEEERYFLRYSISGDSWVELEQTPYNADGGIDDGGSLLYPGYGNYIYALKGGDDSGGGNPGDDFWVYSISRDEWDILPSIPAGVGEQNGHRLGFAGGDIYCWRGCFGDGTLWAHHPELTVPGDFTGDCYVDLTDFTIFAVAYGSSQGDPKYNPLCDLNNDGVINLTDFTIFASWYGKNCWS